MLLVMDELLKSLSGRLASSPTDCDGLRGLI